MAYLDCSKLRIVALPEQPVRTDHDLLDPLGNIAFGDSVAEMMEVVRINEVFSSEKTTSWRRFVRFFTMTGHGQL